MKKIIIIIYILFVSLIFVKVNALTIEELPPIIELGDMDTTSYEINKTITEKDVIINFKNKNNHNIYAWSFNKNKIANIIDLNFELKFKSSKKDSIDSLAPKNKDKFYLSFTHHGDLPATAKMKVSVGNQYKEGSQLYLYYYNETEDTIEYISNNNKVIDGYVEFEINHCSEYFLTGAIINVDSSVSKTLNYVIGVLFLIVFILVAVTLFGN